MNYYFLPGTGIFGGIKVGFRFSALLSSLRVPIVVATPDGTVPHWFASLVPVIRQDAVLRSASKEDTIFFSLPHDYEALKQSNARLVFHCQGTDPLIDPVIKDEKVVLLACWVQAVQYMREKTGRTPINVGISISDEFFYDGRPKAANRIAFMPRRGAELARAAQKHARHVEFVAIDNEPEVGVAGLMKCSDIYLATAQDEWFGLPALEAMAAGCVVLSLPTVGGGEYLEHGKNCIIFQKEKLIENLLELSDLKNEHQRFQLRHAAIVTARKYRESCQRRRLQTLLNDELGGSISWH